ncbi:hypothetical protein BM530_22260, partial [Clostridioides difficile]
TIQKNIRDSIEATKVAEEEVVYGISDTDDKDEIRANIDKIKIRDDGKLLKTYNLKEQQNLEIK